MIGQLSDIAPYLRPALVPARAWRRIERLGRLLPPCSGALIECRLGAGGRAVDLSVRAGATDGGRAIIAGQHPTIQLAPQLLRAPVWRRLRRFCRLWRDPASALHRRVGQLWLEFDAATHMAAAPSPCVFFDIGVVAADHAWISDTALPVLLDRAAPPTLTAQLSRCLGRLPPCAAPHYIGAMLGRPGAGLRLTLRLPVDQLWAYLGDVADGFGADGLRAATAGLLPPDGAVVAHMDLAAAGAPRPGIEVAPADAGGWARLIDGLVERGLCGPAQRRALLAWPGQSGPIGPGCALDVAHSLRPSAERVHVRRLNHIKLVGRPGGGLAAKAYLYIGYGWRSPTRPEPAPTRW